LCALWGSVLGVSRLGIHDDFFALGGHSLLAAQLVARMRDELGLKIGLAGLLTNPTIDGLTQTLSLQLGDAPVQDEVLPPVHADPAARHQPFPLTSIQEAYWIGRTVSLELGNTPAFNYNEAQIAYCDPVQFERAWNRLVDRHPMLRMRVDADGMQYIDDRAAPTPVQVADFSGLDSDQRDAALAQVHAEMTGRSAADAVWSDVRLSKLGPDAWRVHMYLDRMVFDGASLHILYANCSTGEQPTSSCRRCS
jgi:aryl carrier-like protein